MMFNDISYSLNFINLFQILSNEDNKLHEVLLIGFSKTHFQQCSFHKMALQDVVLQTWLCVH